MISTRQLAELLMINPKTLRRMHERGMPRVSHGKWDLYVVLPWYLEQKRIEVSPEDLSERDAKRRYWLAKATTSEVEAAKAQSQHLPVAVVSALVSEVCVDLAGELEAYPLREHSDPHLREIAIDVCRKLRTRLADSAARAERISEPSGRAAGVSTSAQRKSLGGRASSPS